MANRKTERKANPFYRSDFSPASGQTFEVGHMAMFVPASGTITPAAATTARTGDFPSVAGVVNTYAASPTDDQSLDVGVHKFKNGDSVADSNIGDVLFASDSETVAKGNGSGLYPIAGYCEGVDTDGVWTRIVSPGEAAALSGSLLA